MSSEGNTRRTLQTYVAGGLLTNEGADEVAKALDAVSELAEAGKLSDAQIERMIARLADTKVADWHERREQWERVA